MAKTKQGFSGSTNYGKRTIPGIDRTEEMNIRRQSNQFVDVINAASQNTVNVLKSLEAKRTERQKVSDDFLDYTLKFNMESQNLVSDMVAKSGNNNPQLAEAAMWQLDGLNDAVAASKRPGRTEEEQRYALKEVGKYKNRIANLGANIEAEKSAIALFATDAQSRKLNVEGGLNLNSPRGLLFAKQMSITSGLNPGKMTWLVDEEGDWVVKHEGPSMEEPTITKASLFFGEEPGIIPESTKTIQTIMQDKLAMFDKSGNLRDEFIDNDQRLVSIGKGMMQYQSKTNLGLVASKMQPFLKSTALGYASDYNTAEAYWDSLPSTIKSDVKQYMDSENIPYPGDDLQVGIAQIGTVSTQINAASWIAIEQALYRQAEGLVVKNKKGRIMQDPQAASNQAGQNTKLSKLDSLIDLAEKPPEQQVEMIKSKFQPDDAQEINYNKTANTITLTRPRNVDEAPGQIINYNDAIYRIGNKKVDEKEYLEYKGDKKKTSDKGEPTFQEDLGDVMEVYNLNNKSTVDGVGGENQWRSRLANYYLGNTEKDRQAGRQFDSWLTSEFGVTPGQSSTTTQPLDPKLYLKNYNKRNNK